MTATDWHSMTFDERMKALQATGLGYEDAAKAYHDQWHHLLPDIQDMLSKLKNL